MVRFTKSATSLCLFSSLALGVIYGQGMKSRVDLRQIPVRVSLDKQFQTWKINKPCPIIVTLKDITGATVPAVRDEMIQLKYQDQILNGVIPAGQTSYTFQIIPRAAAVGKIEATAGDLARASGFVIGIDPQSRAMTEINPSTAIGSGTRPPVATPTPPPPPPTNRGLRKKGGTTPPGSFETASGPDTAPQAGPTPTAGPKSLRVYVTPDPVDFDSSVGAWKAEIFVALTGSDGNLAPAPDDVPLLLVPASGSVTPNNTTIKKNQPTSDPVTLIWNEAEDNDLQVTSSIAHTTQHIAHDSPEPTALRLEGLPGSVINDGKSPIRIVVMLVDALKTPAPATADTEVVLGSSKGSITPAKVVIGKGQCCTDATLTSAQNGSVMVSALSSGFPQAQIPAVFLFPWMMIIMAASGGLLGAFAHNPRAAFGPHWWRVLLLGLIFGVVLSIAALLGVIGSLPKLGLPIQISQIPSANELGALLLGFVGGLYGKKLWLKGGGDDEPQPKEKAASQPA